MLSALIEFLRTLTTPERLIALLTQVMTGWLSYALFFGIVFAETGLLTGFFLPGDSFLFTIGVVVGAAQLDLRLVLPVLTSAAILGDSTGYLLGRKSGPRIFSRPNSRLFKQEHLRRSREFYEKYGGKTMIYAKFVPIVRTFAPFVAGVSEMPYPRFLAYSMAGALMWVNSIVLLGYFLGGIPLVRRHFDKAILGVIFLSLIPLFLEAWKHHRQKRAAAAPKV
jgi:membrane-associated protein